MSRFGPHMRELATAILAVAAIMAFTGNAALAAKENQEKKRMNIQEVTSPGGIKAWLVEEHGVPLIAMRFAFEGGSAQDPADKAGVAHFVSTMLDEGAGNLDAAAYQERMEDIAMRMSFSTGRDAFYGNFQTLSENREAATSLLQLALTKPLFEETATERLRKQLLTSLSFAKKNPGQLARKAWSATAFPNHPYGRSSKGTVESVSAIQPADLRTFHQNVFAKANLKVTVVGDIDAKTLGKMLDEVFGELPAEPKLSKVPDIEPTGGSLKVLDMPVPQSVAVFGFEGLARNDKDFIPAYIMNHMLGGGGFSSKLMQEVREERGLAYSVYSYLQPYDHAAILAGSVATKNEKLRESLDVIRAEIGKMAEQGPSQAELDAAKSYLTGSYALRFDTSLKIASQLLGIQQEDLGIDYVDKRNDMIQAVTLEDITRVAKRLLKPENLIVTVVGQPKGLEAVNN